MSSLMTGERRDAASARAADKFANGFAIVLATSEAGVTRALGAIGALGALGALGAPSALGALSASGASGALSATGAMGLPTVAVSAAKVGSAAKDSAGATACAAGAGFSMATLATTGGCFTRRRRFKWRPIHFIATVGRLGARLQIRECRVELIEIIIERHRLGAVFRRLTAGWLRGPTEVARPPMRLPARPGTRPRQAAFVPRSSFTRLITI